MRTNCRNGLFAGFAKRLLGATIFFAVGEMLLADDVVQMPWIAVSADRRGFATLPSGKSFVPYGFNYDHDEAGRLIEDYWGAEWKKIEDDFAEMKTLGANVVRVHLQLGKFMATADRPNEQSLARLAKLMSLAEQMELYLDLTGLGCYHKHDVPAWYEKLDESARWEVQANFWKAVAAQCADSPAVFCFDLMNEPVAPANNDHQDWLGPAFAGKHFVQMIGLETRDRPRSEIARAWIAKLVAAIRTVDRRHLVTVGLVDWSLDRPGLTSGFVPKQIAGELDFLCVHLYPEKDRVDAALKTLQGFAVGKPVVIEETFPLKCSQAEFRRFLNRSEEMAAGWIMFYWGTPVGELRSSTGIEDAILLQSLEAFQQHLEQLRSAQATPPCNQG
ncbi:MAG: cellulase family glycosylhydrolase [Pirellulales bacterium]|nr:cellulase family glycosylhydrolase [Pirellulales bacterium]